MHNESRKIHRSPIEWALGRWLPMFVVGTALSLIACSPQGEIGDGGNTSSVSSYFSLEGYFRKQIADMEQAGPEVVKTVDANGNSETRTLTINDWKRELGPFIESDINKPAWVNSYSVDSSAQRIVYDSIEDGLRTKRIIVEKDEQGEVKEIRIHNEVSNLLYTSSERLRYYPDSLYEIIREQDIRIVGHNRYVITGRLDPAYLRLSR